MSDDTTESQGPVEFDPETDTYRTEYSDGTDPPSEVVVRAVAANSGTDPRELDPLYDAIDPDALDTLFCSTRGGDGRGDGEISFLYSGYQISVRSYGVVAIQPDERVT